MARPLSPTEFLDVVEKSKLLGPVALEPYRGTLERYASGDELADALIAEGGLTKFQAENLRQGKWQGFFLGTYRMLEKLGAGSTAVVYLAEHVRLKQRVAIKVLSPQKAQDAETLGRFEREAKAAAAVRHPNVVHAFDVATEGRLHYMVMEYVDGTTLLKRLADAGRMAPRAAARLLHQAAQGLHAAHQAGIVHRDVKPSNVMIAADGTAKVMDLGLARYEADETALTQGKAVLGLVAYSAPEQLKADATVDARTDVYALGATFYLAVVGKRPPVVGTAPPKLPARAPSEEPDYRTLMAVIERMMAVQPADRYQSMAEVATAISISGLLTDPNAVEKAVPARSKSRPAVDLPDAPQPVRPVSRPKIDLPPASLPTLLPDPPVAVQPPPAAETPLPKRTTTVPLLPPKPVVDEDPHAGESFDLRVQGLFESLMGPAPDPDPEPLPLARTPSGKPAGRQWLVAAATFAIVLVLLFMLVR